MRDFGRYYEDFEPNVWIEHAMTKTITESDNNLFCLLTMNHHPVHSNVVYAAQHQHHQILVVGTLVFSLAVGITVEDISGKAVANLSYHDVKHVAPVFLGDTIRVRSKVLDMRLSKSKTDRGIIHVLSEVYNQNDQLVLTFERSVLVFKRGM